MSYYGPFMPHELDSHPDGRRILATLEVHKDEHQKELDKAFDKGAESTENDTAELEYEIAYLTSERDDLQRDITNLKEENRELREQLEELESRAEA